MPKPAPWTAEDREDLWELTYRYTGEKRELNWGKIHARFPNRSKHAIYKQICVGGMGLNRGWSPMEDAILRDNWGEVGIKNLLSKLPNRTRESIYFRGLRLGLHAGTPQGYVSIKSLATDPKWGFNYATTIKMMERAGVRVRTFNYAGKKRGVLCVETDESMRAAKMWTGTEKVIVAAKRLKVRPNTLAHWLTLEGLLSPKDSSRKRTYRGAPEVFDRVAAKYRSMPHLPPRPSPIL